MDKKGVEVSINFIVMFILAMIVFASGLAIMRQIVGDADEAKKRIEEQQREEMERYLCDGSDKVKLIYASMDMKKGENEFAGLCVRNDFDIDKKFYIKAWCDAAYSNTKELICSRDYANCGAVCDTWIVYDQTPYTIYPNEIKKIQDISIIVPQSDVAKGRYIFNILVCEDPSCSPPETQYSTTQKLNINVG
jgi:hypothetical protein